MISLILLLDVTHFYAIGMASLPKFVSSTIYEQASHRSCVCMTPMNTIRPQKKAGVMTLLNVPLSSSGKTMI